MLKLLTIIIIALIIPITANAKTLTGKVVYTYDGDTIGLLDNENCYHRLRLASIDAPEKDQPYGLEATLLLRKLLYQRQVIATIIGTDKYNREIAQVYNGEQAGLCCYLLEQGAAWHLSYFDRGHPHYNKHRQLEWEARKYKRGLWGDEKAVEPWVWRPNNLCKR